MSNSLKTGFRRERNEGRHAAIRYTLGSIVAHNTTSTPVQLRSSSGLVSLKKTAKRTIAVTIPLELIVSYLQS